MKECYFELSYSRQIAHIKELYRFNFFTRPLSLALMIIVCVGFVLNFAFGLLFGDTYNTVISCFLLLIILFRMLSYGLAVRKTIKRQRILCGDQPLNIRMEVYDDCFVQTNGLGKEITVSYDSIKRAYQTKNLFILLSRSNRVYCFPKDAFEKGLPQHFLPFIASRGIKAK